MEEIEFKFVGTGTLTDAQVEVEVAPETDRALASVRRIEEIQPIEGADKIVKAKIGGWWVVTAKDNGFKVGDLVVYLEIDSWVPTEVAPFLTKAGQYPKEYFGVQGERLKTIRLRGQLSQGLILPLSVAIERFVGSDFDEGQELMEFFYPDQDLTKLLGVLKWEKPVAPNMKGLTKGNFPHFIRKTDEERCQNIVKEIFQRHVNDDWEVTIKLEGSSITAYHFNGEVGVCSRNLNLKLEGNEENTYIRAAMDSGLIGALAELGGNYAVQGELMGPGIEGNIEGFQTHSVFVYKIWDIDNQHYLDPLSRGTIIGELRRFGAKLEHVPILYDFETLEDLGITNIDELIAFADGPSINAKWREGLVFKSHQHDFSFKVISNVYLENEK